MTTELSPDILRPLLPERPEDGHKGTFGHSLIAAGSQGFSGAARLCAEAAYRSGVGLVTVAVPEPLGPVVAAGLVEAMTLWMPGAAEGAFSEASVSPLLGAATERDAVALGPGIGCRGETARFVRAFVEQCRVPLVIDADGLNCLCEAVETLKQAKAPVVVTPHPGEMARLAGCSVKDVQADREAVATRFANAHNCTVVLKGRHTVVASGDEGVFVNPAGSSGMATGGTGDVLTGLIGGLLAQGMTAHHAAMLGAYIHGIAGDHAAEQKTQRGMIARDVIECIPAAWRAIETKEHT